MDRTHCCVTCQPGSCLQERRLEGNLNVAITKHYYVVLLCCIYMHGIISSILHMRVLNKYQTLTELCIYFSNLPIQINFFPIHIHLIFVHS